VHIIPPVTDRSSTATRFEANAIRNQAAHKAWFAVYTAPRHEKFVHAQLVAKQIQSFLPLYKTVRKWKNGVRREIDNPLFPGYLFVHLAPDERLPVLQTSGVVHFVGKGTAPVALDEQEMNALRVGAQRFSLLPRDFLSAGDSVCITRGPLRGVRGYVEREGNDMTFVVSIQLIQKSFAIRVEANDLELAS
jgi:transcription antitermination factor NusG